MAGRAQQATPGDDARRDLYQGFGNALATAFEMVATPALFVLLGVWLDGRVGTRPLCAVVLGVLALTAVVLKAYYGYRDAIDREEEGKPWRR